MYDAQNIDYRGADVTPEKFLAALKGDAKAAGGKVLKTNKNSKIFVFFSDHGAPGLIAFPQKYLYADKLNDAIEFMHEKNLYKEMVFYIEACESGSMFPKLKDNIGVYAMTASNAELSSWATYCSPHDKVKGKSIGTCLGDLFSVNWLEDTEKNNILSETLETQHEKVKKLTAQSPVQIFGQQSILKEPVADFQGTDDNPIAKHFSYALQKI